MRAPFAEWRGPLPGQNFAAGQLAHVIGVTVHHMDGSLSSADASFHDPARGASAHFGIGYDGHIVQWVDTADVAYHACQANWTGWVGIENESDPNLPDGPPTAAQIAAMGQIIAWLGIPAVPASSPTSGGVGYHRQFGGPCATGWGQTACPGQGFIDAISAICAAAGGAAPTNPAKGTRPMYREDKTDGTHVYWSEGLGDFYQVPDAVGIGAGLNGVPIVPITTAERVAMGVSLNGQAAAWLAKHAVATGGGTVTIPTTINLTGKLS